MSTAATNSRRIRKTLTPPQVAVLRLVAAGRVVVSGAGSKAHDKETGNAVHGGTLDALVRYDAVDPSAYRGDWRKTRSVQATRAGIDYLKRLDTPAGTPAPAAPEVIEAPMLLEAAPAPAPAGARSTYGRRTVQIALFAAPADPNQTALF